MKNFIIPILILLNSTILFAQLSGQAKIDSLLKELPNMKEDTNGVNLLQRLSFSLRSTNPEKGIEYGLKGVELAIEIGWKKGEAKCYNALGANNGMKSDYLKALEYYLKALKMNEELGNKSGIGINLGNIGSIYHYQFDYPKALEYYHKSLKINKEIGNKSRIAVNLGNIGSVYQKQSNYSKALEYYHKSINISKELDYKYLIASNLGNIGNVYIDQSDYLKGLEYYQKALKISQELGKKDGVAINLGNIGKLYFTLSQDSVLTTHSEGTELVSLKKEINLNKSIENSLQAIKIFEEIGELKYRSETLENLANAYRKKNDYKKADKYFQESIILKDSVFNQKNSNEITRIEKAREEDLKKAEIEKQKALIVEQEKREQILFYSAVIVVFLIVLILILVINSRRKSEKLLLNILPASIAKRLKAKEENIADDFEKATTVFIDLVGFTSFAKDKKASEVVKVLNKIFHRFDDLVKKHGLEKIKTMGDGYLAVAGVPEPDTNHCQKAIDFALDVRRELDDFNQEMGLEINARIGLESGPLVAGVIGSSKFIYDIWGDSVNTASRMESTGTPGKIQITENVKNELEKQATNLQFEKRDAFEVKGKGLMQTYFLD